MGIDSFVPSEHIVKICDIETITSLSNSYAAPYMCALIANKLNNDKTLDTGSGRCNRQVLYTHRTKEGIC